MPDSTLHSGQHLYGCDRCHIVNRRNAILTRALNAPEGLPPHRFTAGMSKADALQFWVDAKALNLMVVGKTERGAKLFALRSYRVER